MLGVTPLIREGVPPSQQGQSLHKDVTDKNYKITSESDKDNGLGSSTTTDSHWSDEEVPNSKREKVRLLLKAKEDV